MSELEIPKQRRRWTSLATAAVAGASVIALAVPATIAYADPVAPTPTPAEPTAAVPADPNAPAPAAADPNAATPAPADPNAVPADPNAVPADPNAAPAEPVPAAPEPGRVNNAAGGFSFVIPAGWTLGDASKLNYGQALLTKEVPAPAPGQAPAAANTDTSILLGRLDLKLFAGAEPDDAKAAARLASDMGEFFMPYAGTRVNQETAPLNAGGMPGSASYYEVKFTDSAKPNGQIWAGVVGQQAVNAPRGQRNERWFVVWLGTGKDPVDKTMAAALANSIRQWTPPAAPAADPNAPATPAPALAPGQHPVGVPVPVEGPPEMMPQG